MYRFNRWLQPIVVSESPSLYFVDHRVAQYDIALSTYQTQPAASNSADRRWLGEVAVDGAAAPTIAGADKGPPRSVALFA
jgi:hypothetical protein